MIAMHHFCDSVIIICFNIFGDIIREIALLNFASIIFILTIVLLFVNILAYLLI